jgi:hypothetical protein
MSAIVPKSQRAHYLMITAIAKYLKKWMTYKCVNSTLKTIFLQKKMEMEKISLTAHSI